VALLGPGDGSAGVVQSDVPTPALRQVADDVPGQVHRDTPISFNRDIRPILSDRCFTCHGPDAAIAKDAGGFRLDTRETAVIPTEGGDTPIVPGDPAASELINRITNHNANLLMPPPASNLSLNAHEIDLLTRWIEQGAVYEGHWAYQPPTMPEVPVVAHEQWPRNAIDYFIAARLEQQGLAPSPEADRATLIRRLSLDLVGLPPTPQEIDAFINDNEEGAYERVVDRLLASPHFGERMAMPWLDAARFADTIGYQLDHYQSAWPWRQWVVEAFNSNMPYDQFVVEQLAGDLLPNATDSQQLATTFNRLHMMNHEGGSIDEEFLVEAVGDRIETISTVFMAQTYACARCHDHKYDPTTQDDYYSLYAYFNSIDERGVYTNRPEHALAYGPRIEWFTDEQRDALTQAQTRLEQAQADRIAATPQIVAEQAAWEQALRGRYGVRWAETELIGAQTTDRSGVIEIKPDGSALLAGRDIPGNENLTLTLHTQATGLRIIQVDALTDPWQNNHVGRAEHGNAIVTGIRLHAVSLQDPQQTRDVNLRWAWATQSQQDNDLDALNLLTPGGPGWGADSSRDNNPRSLLLVADEPFGFEGGTELRLTVENQSRQGRSIVGRVRASFASASAEVVEAFPVVMRDWHQAGPYAADSLDAAYDTAFGPESSVSPLAAGPAGGDQRWEHKPDYTDGDNHRLNGQNRAYYLGRTILSPVDRQVTFTLASAAGLRVYLNQEEVQAYRRTGDNNGPMRVTLSLRAGENLLVIKFVNGQGANNFNVQAQSIGDAPLSLAPLGLTQADRRTDHADQTFTEQWRVNQSQRYAELSDTVRQAQRALEAIQNQATPVAVMRELDEPRPMFVLARGQYNARIQDRPAVRHVPEFLGLPMPEGAPNNRLGFALWLTQPDHPLTARVQVNRLWQMLFGTGIVATVEDFGSQADWPSHPDLLDYLAVDFVRSGWDQKAMIKQIVMSATYRQAAVTNPASVEIDPDNRLLSYFPRQRMTGELIRDQALAVSGLLNDQIGGPSVRPYQPAGLWREVSMGPRSNTNIFERGDGDDLYRRSMYTFIKRKAPPPQMATFGTPNREACVVRRDVTNTPLQALVLWNDEQFLEAARVLAQRTLAEAQGDDARLSLIFRRCTGRTPDEQAVLVLRQTLDYFRQRYTAAPQDAQSLLQQGEHPLPERYDPAELASWMMVSSAVLSLDETIVRD